MHALLQAAKLRERTAGWLCEPHCILWQASHPLLASGSFLQYLDNQHSCYCNALVRRTTYCLWRAP